MGKYAATRAVQRDRSSNPHSLSSVGGYLFDHPSTEQQFYVQSFVAGFDPTGFYSGYLSARDNTAYMRDYLRNTGQDWSDIRYPTRTSGWGSSGASGSRAVAFVSRNFDKLY